MSLIHRSDWNQSCALLTGHMMRRVIASQAKAVYGADKCVPQPIAQHVYSFGNFLQCLEHGQLQITYWERYYPKQDFTVLSAHIFKILPFFSKLDTLIKKIAHKIQNTLHLLQNEALDSKYHKHISKAHICKHLCHNINSCKIFVLHRESCVVFCKKCLMKLKTDLKVEN